MRKLILIIIAVALVLVTHAQQAGQDTVSKDTLHIAEQLIIQQQQKRLDSLIKERLEDDLSKLAADSKEKEELEKKLRQIAINDSLRNVEQQRKIVQLRQTAIGYPVTLENDTLFSVYVRLGSFNSAERAAAITTRIHTIFKDDFFSADSLRLVQSENTQDIVYKDMIVMSVTDLDALFADQPAKALGETYLQTIKQTVLQNRQSNSLLSWLKRLALVALVIAGIALVIYIINRLYRILIKKIIAGKKRYFKGITFKSFRLFNEKEHLRFSLRILTIFRIITIILALYLSLPLLFSIFPQTKEYTYTLLNWIISPAKSVLNGIVRFLPNLFTILVIYFFTRYTIKAIHFLANEIEKGDLHIKGFFSDWAQPTFNIVRFLLYAFMVVVIFPYLPGSGSPAFQGVSVFLGILFSLGSSSAIANIVAGLVITYMRPFKVGDRVKINDITGDVLEKTMLVTRIMTIKNEEITVPNASVLSSYTTNYTNGAMNSGLIIHSTVTIGYDVPWKKIHEALINAARRTNGIENDPAPFVLQTALQDFYVAYQVNAYTRQPSSLAMIYSQLHQNIQDCCKEAGIEIMSPHYRAMRDGNMSTIPEDDRQE